MTLSRKTLEEVLIASARSKNPISEDAIHELASMAGVNPDFAIEKHDSAMNDDAGNNGQVWPVIIG